MRTGGRRWSVTAAALMIAVPWMFALTLMPWDGSCAATSANSRSAMGINLAAVTYYSSEQPFINDFATSEGWITHSGNAWDTNEEKYLKVDSDGWPVSLRAADEPVAQQFNSVGVLILKMPNTPNGNYPAGRYVVLYDGEGTLSYGFDAALVSRSRGRDVIKVSPSADGIDLRIVATDPHHTGNYVRNIRVIAATNETAAKSGELFNPSFLKLMGDFRALRFMDWFRTNGSTLTSWANRSVPTNAFFGTTKGVPIEIAVRLANTVSADAWLNVPVMADDDFIRRMAELVRGQLRNTQRVYVELSNEVWNPAFSQFRYAAERGQALWPSRPSAHGGYEYNRNWFGMRSAQMCDIWKSVWRTDPRLVCVLGAQTAWSFSATEALQCPYWTQGTPCSAHGIGAVAIAPYLGEGGDVVPQSWTSQPDRGLSNLFRSIEAQNHPSIPAGGFLGQDIRWLAQFSRDLSSYKLPLLAYEGGQHFASGSTDALNGLYIAANRDPRIAPVYARYFDAWKAAGGQLFMYYNDIGVGSKYGSWGALESIMQTTTPLESAPPKWQAMEHFIRTTPCWWPNCAGTVN